MVSLKTAKSGIAFPSDLTLLKQVFDRVRVDEGIPVGSEQAERLSVIAMEFFSDGEFDEAVLTNAFDSMPDCSAETSHHQEP